jgi:photosystem II stability/assembly factor-like uncharacterized protein
VKQIRWHSYRIRVSPCASRNPQRQIIALKKRGFVKAKVNSTGRLLGLASIASWLAIQAWPGPSYSHRDSQKTFEHDRIAADSIGAMSPLFDRVNVSREKAAEVYGGLPIGFEANCGQADPQVKYLSRAGRCNLFLTAKEAVINLPESTRPSSHDGKSDSANANPQSCMLRMKLVGASNATRITALEELPGKTNYFIGNDPKKWRTNVPTYSSVKFQNIYPGVDVVYYGTRRELEYDFIVAPGASFKPIGLTFEGARRIRLDASGDLLIETPIGEIRQHKPLIYQQASGVKQAISGRYVMRGEREVGFEVGGYDPSRAMVIDPVFVYSTSIGGLDNDSANAVAVDAAGNAYLTGTTASLDFPTVNPFQRNIGLPAVYVRVPTDAFVAKLNPSGALLYSTYLGGISSDTANGIAVDSTGNAYVTGFAASGDFPTTAGAFQTKASSGGDAFITKLNPAGNALSYSTYLGGSTSPGFSTAANVGRGIAVDQEGSAYVAGYTFSESFPLKKPAQGQFNKGFEFGFDCLHFSLAPTREDAFVTKLDPLGAGLVYSTYLGGSNTDEAYGIAVDSSGSAYVTGTTCSFDFPNSTSSNDTAAAAFLVKLSPSGKTFVYARSFGGRGNDFGNGVAVDSEGNAYVTGQTDSDDFPTTPSAFQPRLGGSVLYATTDGGETWRSISGFPNSSATAVAIDPTNPLRMFAGLNGRLPGPGLLESTDGGDTWGNNANGFPFPNRFASAIAIDPKNPSVIYTDLYKTTNGGLFWTPMRFPFGGPSGPARLLVDPVNSSTVYLLSLGGLGGDVILPPRFFKTTDGGGTWDFIRNGASLFGATSAVLDPKSPSTIYATSVDLYKSTDGGNTWRVPYEGHRSFLKLAINPINTSTLYLSDTSGSVFKTTDAGTSFTRLATFGIPINELQVDPINSATVYGATGSAGGGGAVFKSTDGGQTWKATDLIAATVNSLTIDPLNPSRIFAAVDFDIDSFVIKSNPAGSALVYSTYLGSRSPDMGAGIGVDAVRNAYVTGRTLSDRFPSKDALQVIKHSGLFDTAIFTTKLDVAGSAILFSTYAGGRDPSFGSGIAVDPAGKVYLAGTTGMMGVSPSGASTESVFSGFDAFVIKIASPPRIADVLVSGKNLIVTGDGFDRGAVILIDGVEQRSRNDESKPGTVLIAKKAAKNIAPGQRVSIRVRNSDGLLSESFSFTRSP